MNTLSSCLAGDLPSINKDRQIYRKDSWKKVVNWFIGLEGLKEGYW